MLTRRSNRCWKFSRDTCAAPGGRGGLEGCRVAEPEPERQLRCGVVGLGLGAARIVREMELAPYIELYAAAETDPEVRARFSATFPDVKLYDTIERLAADSGVEAVWLATPNRLHAM